MGRKKQKKKRLTRMEKIAEGDLPEPLENLRLRLSSPRLRATGTIKTYLETAERFLMVVGGKKPNDNDVRRYFLRRREDGISERTLRKEFFHLKKLFQSNTGWNWPFGKDDVPFPRKAAFQPALERPIIERLILERSKYTEAERFYLAVSTTFGCRREELANIDKRDKDDESISIAIAKQKGEERIVRHLIPTELKRVFDAYTPKKHEPEAMSQLFQRICSKSGVQKQHGWGWHSIRRSLRTEAEPALAKNDIPLSFWADYQGWAPATKGTVYAGSPMMGVYSHPEILSSDPFFIDKLIYPVHPFLHLWADKKLARQPTRKKTPILATNSAAR